MCVLYQREILTESKMATSFSISLYVVHTLKHKNKNSLKLSTISFRLKVFLILNLLHTSVSCWRPFSALIQEKPAPNDMACSIRNLIKSECYSGMNMIVEWWYEVHMAKKQLVFGNLCLSNGNVSDRFTKIINRC